MKSTNQPLNESNQPNDLNSYGKTNNSTAKTLVAIAAGAAAGAVTAMLLAPKTGSETRKVIAESASKLKDGVTDSIKQGIDKLSSKMEQTLATANTAKDEMVGAVKQGAKTAANAANDLSDQIKKSY